MLMSIFMNQSTIVSLSKLTEDTFCVEVLKANPGNGREQGHHDVEIKEEGSPCRRLMLRH